MDNTSDKDQNKKPDLVELINLTQAAEICGLSPDHLRRLAAKGSLWAKKIGRDWVTTEHAIKEYMAQERHPGPRKRD